MKIIDQTPFYNHETGEISILDRGKAMMKYGANWSKEVEAQKQIVDVLGGILDRNFTLLRNITPPSLETTFPLILVGPAGVFVMYVTPLTGMFRAKGDQWGTISGNAFKNEKPNLMTRTERMARAVQVFLRREGFAEITSVDAVLLFSDPSVHVDSIRPIIRVVMRDALERFAISLTQARVVLSSESVHGIIDRILNQPKTVPPQPAETPAVAASETPVTSQPDVAYIPAITFPESEAPALSNESIPLPLDRSQPLSQVPQRKGLDKKQLVLLIAIFVFWCLLIIVFLFLAIKNQSSILLSLLP